MNRAEDTPPGEHDFRQAAVASVTQAPGEGAEATESRDPGGGTAFRREAFDKPAPATENPEPVHGEKPELRAPGRVAAFLRGFSYPLTGLRMILSNFRLFKWSIAPIAINIGVFIALLALAWHYGTPFIEALRPGPGLVWYLAMFRWIAYLLAWILLPLVYVLVCVLSFTIVGNALASPFLDILSERTEWVFFGREEEAPFSIGLLLRDIGAVLFEELLKLLLWLAVMLPLCILLIVPVAGELIFIALSTCLTVFFLGMAFCDFSLSRRRQPISVKKAFAWRNRWRILGLGTAVYVSLLVPLLGFVCLPMSTVGGTLLFCEHSTEEERAFITGGGSRDARSRNGRTAREEPSK